MRGLGANVYSPVHGHVSRSSGRGIHRLLLLKRKCLTYCMCILSQCRHISIRRTLERLFGVSLHLPEDNNRGRCTLFRRAFFACPPSRIPTQPSHVNTQASHANAPLQMSSRGRLPSRSSATCLEYSAGSVLLMLLPASLASIDCASWR